MLINPKDEIQALRDKVTQREGLGLKVDYMHALSRLTALQHVRDNWHKMLFALGGNAHFGIESGAYVQIGDDLTLQLTKPMPDWKEYAGAFNYDE